MVKKTHEHNWKPADDMKFVAGRNKGASADVFCAQCDMGAFVDECGDIISRSIAKVELGN